MDELVSLARQGLMDLRRKAHSVASWGVVTKSGKVITTPFSINTACHAPCSGFVIDYKGEILFTITIGQYGKDFLPDEIKERYFTWLCSEDSPWAECLNNGLNTDPKFMSEYGLLVINMDKLGKNFVIGALAASRACYEHPLHIKMWDKLVQDGVKPRWAFFMAGFTTFYGDERVTFGMVSNQNHWPLHPWAASEEYIRNYITQNVKFDAVLFASPGAHGPVGGAWGPYGDIVTSKYGSPSYGVSSYWTGFKELAKIGVSLEPGTFVSLQTADYKDFLEAVKHEQGRLYA